MLVVQPELESALAAMVERFNVSSVLEHLAHVLPTSAADIKTELGVTAAVVERLECRRVHA